MFGVVGYLMTALLQISWKLWQRKNFENRPAFDEVMCKMLGPTFFWHTLYTKTFYKICYKKLRKVPTGTA